MRNIDPLYKLQKNIKIAMLYLEDDDPVNAETFIRKAASLVMHNTVRCPASCRWLTLRSDTVSPGLARQHGSTASCCRAAVPGVPRSYAARARILLRRTLPLSCSTRRATRASWTPSASLWRRQPGERSGGCKHTCELLACPLASATQPPRPTACCLLRVASSQAKMPLQLQPCHMLGPRRIAGTTSSAQRPQPFQEAWSPRQTWSKRYRRPSRAPSWRWRGHSARACCPSCTRCVCVQP